MTGFDNHFASEDPRCPDSLPKNQVKLSRKRIYFSFFTRIHRKYVRMDFMPNNCLVHHLQHPEKRIDERRGL